VADYLSTAHAEGSFSNAIISFGGHQMAGTHYEVAYVARSPASMQQDEFATMVDELCNGRAGEGWWLVSTAGDYGANLTLGVWLIFAREAASAPDEPLIETGADEDVAPAAGLDEDSDESPESAGKRWWG
jgi:hypothetical protein